MRWIPFLSILVLFSCTSGDLGNQYHIRAQLLLKHEAEDSGIENLERRQELEAVMKSYDLIHTSLSKLGMDSNSVEKHQENLHLEWVEFTSILQLDYYTDSANQGIELLEAMMHEMIEHDVHYRLTPLEKTIEGIDLQIDSVAARLDTLENQLAEMRERANPTIIPENFQKDYQELETLNKVYVFLLEKRASSVVNKASVIPNIKIIEIPRVVESL